LQVNLKLLNPARLHKTNSVKYRLYSPTAMTNAYMAVKKQNMSVGKAARQFSIPRQTLRDRTTGQIDADCIENCLAALPTDIFCFLTAM
jgi:hypothetical protein